MTIKPIQSHLSFGLPQDRRVGFTWNGNRLTGRQGQTALSAFLVRGDHVVGHQRIHPKRS